MQIIERFDAIDLSSAKKPVWLTIGVFDGLHIGHRELMRLITEGASASGGTSVVFTFREHPLTLLAPPHAPRRLVTLRRRRQLLQTLGVDVLIEIPFTRDFAAIEARDFIADVLVKRCHVAHVTCGSNFRFGRDGRGDTALLGRHAARHGFTAHPLPEVRFGPSTASSTAIRDMVMQGAVERAAEALRRPFELEGTVVHGDGRGRLLGFPTANVEPAEGLILPAHGVYAAMVRTGDLDDHATPSYPAMVNIGVRPTFGGRRSVIEAHLLDFSGDLYDRPIEVSFIRRLRGEKPFAGADALVAQLRVDEQETREALGVT